MKYDIAAFTKILSDETSLIRILDTIDREIRTVEASSFLVKGSVAARNAGSLEYREALVRLKVLTHTGSLPEGASFRENGLYRHLFETLVANNVCPKSVLGNWSAEK